MQGKDILIQKSHRLIFIDVLRGIAILWMIETHIVDACLYQYMKSGAFYYYLNISNGFVAVTFLFCAGAGFWLAAMKKSGDYRHFRKPLWIYLRRLGLILAFGYWLHLPILSFRRTFNINYEQYIHFIECNILHAIVFSSLLALILLLLNPNLKWLPYIFAILALIFFFFTPAIRSSDPFLYMPDYLAVYFSKPPVSGFPVFPWSGYFFAGAALTAVFYKIKDKRKLAKIVVYISFAVIIIALIIKNAILEAAWNQDWWNASPGHSFFRVGFAALTFAILYLIEEKYKNMRAANMLRICGQESLFLYVFHLMIVYGSVMNVGINHIVGPQLGWIKIALIIIVICSISYLFTKIWHQMKADNLRFVRYVMLAMFVGFFIVYLINP